MRQPFPKGSARRTQGQANALATPPAPSSFPRRALGQPPWKIVWASPCWFRGGLETVTLTLIQHLDKSLWTHTILAGKHDRATSIIPDGVELVVDDAIHEWVLPSNPPTYRDRTNTTAATNVCRDYMRSLQPDVLVSSLLPTGSWAGVKEGVPVVVEYGHCGAWWDLYPRPCDAVYAVSEATAAIIRDNRPTANVEVIYNGIADNFCPGDGASMRPALGFRPGELVVGFAGRLVSEKRPEEWLSILSAARCKFGPHVRGLMVGASYGYAPTVNRVMDELGFEWGREVVNVQFDYSEMPLAFRMMDVLMHTRTDEPFGMVIPEALLCGTPVVGYAGGGMKEIGELLATKDCVLVEPGEADDLRDALFAMLARKGKRASKQSVAKTRSIFGADAMARNLEKRLLAFVEANRQTHSGACAREVETG